MIVALGLISVGYALAYYAVDVLVWAHFSTATEEPVPFGACLGFPLSERSTPFMPPAKLGLAIPGAITDARGLMGGIPTTGVYQQVTATAPAAAPGSGGGVPGGGGGAGTPPPSGGGARPAPKPGDSNFVGPVSRPFVPDNVSGGFRDATPGEIAKSRLSPAPAGRRWVTDGNGGFTLK